MTVSQLSGYPPVQAADDVLAAGTVSLADEHGLLLRQVAIRAKALLTVAAAGGWPAGELRALLGYLRAEVLRQAEDEERLLFPVRGGSRPGRLARDHTRLRAGIDALERAAGNGAGSPAKLASLTRDLLRQLERHLAAEEAMLTGPGQPAGTPTTRALGGRPHEWYPLTEGDVIDLDALPRDQVAEAAADRALRLRYGEQVELRSGSDPYRVRQRVDELAPGRYGFIYLEDGPRRWRVQMTRRAARTG